MEFDYGSANGKYIRINNLNIYYEEYGKGHPLFLIHGGFGSIHDFRKVIPELSKHFRVIAADSPGHGRSEQAKTLSYQLMASYFSSLIDELTTGYVHVLGFSDGGNTSLIVSANRPDRIKKNVVSGAVYTTDGYVQEINDFFARLTPEVAAVELEKWLSAYSAKSPNKDQWQKFVYDNKRMAEERIIISEERLKQMNTSTLIIQGDQDIVKLEHTIALHRMINGSQLCVLPATSHYVFTERPDWINPIVINFLNETDSNERTEQSRTH
jgi:pimeloyl-ACP methyl ester carboxylesterase